jgi:hypothetical protein
MQLNGLDDVGCGLRIGGGMGQPTRATRVHQTRRVAPAMQAGVTDHTWTLAEIVALLG